MTITISRRRRIGLGILTGLATLAAVSALAVFAANPPKVGEKAPDFTLKALDGTSVTLSTLTKKHPVALIVLRGYPGYQCPFCTAQVGELLGNRDKFTAANDTQVVLVYPGPAADLQEHGTEFVSGMTVPKNFHLLLDPDYTFVNRYGLRWNLPGETAFPSTFVLNQKGKIVFEKISHEHGDRATADEILAALPAKL